MLRSVATLAFLALALLTVRTQAGSWRQFRGPNGSALADDGHKLPAEIGPDQNVLWKVPLPPGHSSPVVVGDRVYLTAVRDGRLFTLALDRGSGKTVWEAEAPVRKLEKIHQIGSHAQSTPAADGAVVVSLFGSSGLYGYDRDGKRLWHVPMGPFKNEFGAGSSPLLVGDTVILSQDHDSGSFLLALNKRTGKTVWRTDRSEFPVSYASPVVWEVGGRKQIVVAGTLRVVGYDFETGQEVWTVRGLARICNMTPTVGPDGILYLATWAAGADPGERFVLKSFDELIAAHDANKNGTLEAGEMPAGPIKDRYAQIDRDKDGHVTRDEYEGMRQIFEAAQNRMVAIRPGGRGDVTTSHVLWTQGKHLPYVPSPLYANGVLFLAKNGGLVTSLDARTGRILKHDRVPGGAANYYASPVGGDGKVYLLSEKGHLSVVSAEPRWRVLHRSRFDEDVFATPAIVDGRIYLRTAGHLYCFGTTP